MRENISPVRNSLCFNPRPYVRGDERETNHRETARGFNPRPYVRGDGKCDEVFVTRRSVSIRAPT